MMRVPRTSIAAALVVLTMSVAAARAGTVVISTWGAWNPGVEDTAFLALTGVSVTTSDSRSIQGFDSTTGSQVWSIDNETPGVAVEVDGCMAISDRNDYGFFPKIRAAFPGNAG